MNNYTFFTEINKDQIIKVIIESLRTIDDRLVEHGERVAYIAYELFTFGKLPLQWNLLLPLAIFHDIGAYKTNIIDKMIEFENSNVWEHSVYGYLFLKNMTPLGELAEAILYHHVDYQSLLKINPNHKLYAEILYLADRIDMFLRTKGEIYTLEALKEYRGSGFEPHLVDLFLQANEEKNICKNLLDLSFHQLIINAAHDFDFPQRDAVEYLKMLVFAIDFRSVHTVTHTINTTTISLELGRLYGFDAKTLEKIYFGALLHDVGKITTPISILEFEGALNYEQMEEMKLHVVHTGKIINGLVDEEIAKIAVRHHEKLDGTGYPLGLKAKDLTIPERIVAIADILSALSGKRSYKDVFPKDKIISIISDMAALGKLDNHLCSLVVENYDLIMEHTDESKDPIMKIYLKMADEYIDIMHKINLML